MKLQPYINKLNSSDEFKSFKEKYPNSFVMAGFFILDLEQGKNLHQIDYYVPGEKKVAAFSLDAQVKMQMLDLMGSKTPQELDIKTKIDLDALAGILEDEMKNRNITEEVKKIIAVVQNINGKKLWNLNCVLSGMELLRAHIDDDSKTVLKMEKISMMEILKHVPREALAGMQGKNVKIVAPGASSEEGAESEEETEGSEEEKELKKLDELEEKIEKAKTKLKFEMEKKSAKSEKPAKVESKEKKAKKVKA